MNESSNSDNRESLQSPRFPLEVITILVRGGWYPGIYSETELNKFNFPVHQLARKFICEFTDVDMGKLFSIDAKIANQDHRRFEEVAKAGLKNCMPIGPVSDWVDDALWMDEAGAMYISGDKFSLIGSNPDEGLEFILLRKSLRDRPSWKVEWVPLPWQIKKV